MADRPPRIPSMKLRQLALAPRAIGYWLGIAGQGIRDDGSARILMLHGIPRRHARLFERVIRYVRRHFQVVPLRDLVAEKAPSSNRRMAITFDDGLRNNLEVAYPVLKAHGVPATFFV